MNQLKLSPIITIIAFFCLGAAPVSAGAQPKQHDPSLAVSADAAIRLHRAKRIVLVDVRRPGDFERLRIPGSLNIPLYAIKTKVFLESSSLVLVNQGFHYAELGDECRRLADRGFQVSILDGGLPAWKRRGGSLAGDLFALDTMKTVSPQVFMQEKDYESTLVVDISPTRSEASIRLIPNAKHMPVFDNSDRSIAELRGLININMPFQSIVIFNESGEQYENIEKRMNRMGIETFNLQGGLAGYQKYLEGLQLSRKPRSNRMKTVSNCKPCGERQNGETSPTNK